MDQATLEMDTIKPAEEALTLGFAFNVGAQWFVVPDIAKSYLRPNLYESYRNTDC